MVSREDYRRFLTRVERVHRWSQGRLRRELARLEVRDVEPGHAAILLDMGLERMSVGELVRRGAYYQPTLSAQISRLREAGYNHHERSAQDKRVRLVSLTDKGRELLEVLTAFYDKEAADLAASISVEALGSCGQTLRHLEQVLERTEGQTSTEPELEEPAFTSGSRVPADAQDEQDRPSLDAMVQALRALSPEQREALILARADDLTYQEAALVCGVAVGTIKSRINRGGDKLAALLRESPGLPS